ncbi:hypothetical protein ACH5RR_009845 [Cinchona calisaya]|uniref:dolichol kinase n=1 Tax=Cinchona calisaya TaxID=153742 RepID=A0ABD3AII3_9GENT
MMMMMLIPSRNSSNQGGSSGILLGAVTLLGLMLSRLLQISRGLSLSEVGVADLEFIQLQYWAASASCFGVLIFLHIILQREDNSVSAVGSYSYGKTKVSLSCITLYAGVCCSAFSAKSYFGRVANGIDVILGGHLWTSGGKTNSEYSSNISSLCSHWRSAFGNFWPCNIFWRHACSYCAKIFGYMASSRYLSLHYDVKRSEISTMIQPEFLDLAFGAALAVFLILEIIRVWKNWSLGQLVYQFMNAFTDHRDSEILIIGHFSLLLGCALPTWLSSGFKDQPLAPFAGILSLGIGDTMASMVGHKYGVLRWSKTGKKIIEGTAAGITSILFACCLLLPLLATTGYIFTQPSPIRVEKWELLTKCLAVLELSCLLSNNCYQQK